MTQSLRYLFQLLVFNPNNALSGSFLRFRQLKKNLKQKNEQQKLNIFSVFSYFSQNIYLIVKPLRKSNVILLNRNNKPFKTLQI